MLPRSGDVVRVTKAASVQFGEPFLFRVIRIQDWLTADGWAWFDGYQLDASGDAIERRLIYVKPDGLQIIPPMNAGPRQNPRQRASASRR